MGTYYNIVRSRTEHTIQNPTWSFQFGVQRTAVQMTNTVVVKWIVGTDQGYGSWHQVYSGTMNPMQTLTFNISNTDLLNEMRYRSSSYLDIKVARLVNGEESDPVTGEYIVRIDGNTIRSVFTSVTQSIQSTPIRGYLISGYSTARITYSATKGTGAHQMNFWFIPDQGTATPTSDTSTADTFTDYFDLTTDRRDANFNFDTVVNVNDSRQQYLDTRTVNTRWYGYTKPNITASIRRCDRSGNYDESGAYVKIRCSATYSLESIGNSGSVYVTQGGNTYYDGDIVAQAVNVATTYTVVARDTVLDSASETVTRTITVNMAKFPLDLYDDGRGNLGARVGTIAERGYFSCGLKQKGIYFYGTCATGRSTARKVVSDVDQTFQLYTGVLLYVKFTNANGKANPTLNVNGTGAITIRRYGSTAPSTSRASSWNAGSVVAFIYDGSVWQMVGWLNTTYSAISQANIENRTGTSTGLITGQRLQQGFDVNLGAHTGTYVYNSTSATQFSFIDANMVGYSYIICGTQDAGNPVLRASLTSSTGEITIYLSSAVSVMRVNYICF